MIVSTVAELVECVRDLANEAGDRQAARELEDLRLSLVPFAEQVINATSRKVIRASFGNEDLQMRFGRALAFLKIFQRGSEKIGRAADVKALQGMISDLEVTPATQRAKGKPPRPANDVIDVDDVVADLRKLGTDRTAFEPLFNKLSKGASVRELNKISLEYAGSDGHRSKDSALAAVRGRFESKVQRQRKSDDIQRLSSRRKKS